MHRYLLSSNQPLLNFRLRTSNLLSYFLSLHFSNRPPRLVISRAPPLLILHDRNATNTQIPVLPTHLRLPKTRKRSRNRMNGNNEEGEEEEEQDRESIDGGDVGERIQVERIMECFFDWTGKVGRGKFSLSHFLASNIGLGL